MSLEPRPSLPALIETVRHRGWELDVQTVDRGMEHACILSNLFHEGGLLVSRKVAYAPDAAPLLVRELMRAHHAALVAELQSGALDKELVSVIAEDQPWATPQQAPPASAAPAPRPTLPPRAQDPSQLSSNSRATVTFQPAQAGRKAAFVLVLEEPRAFLDVHFHKGETQGVLLETGQDVALGTPVELAVRFLGKPIRQFYLEGVVTWRRAKGARDLKAGLGVEFPKAQAVALERVTEFALGIHDLAADRRHPRARCLLRARLDVDGGGRHDANVLNLSLGGALVTGAPLLAPGTMVTLTVDLGLFRRSLRLRSVVRWARQQPAPALGLQFLLEDAPALAGRLQGLVDRLLKQPQGLEP